MSCKECHSANQREFSAEINVHFPEVKGLNIPTVWVFPKILFCMDCGAAEFSVPDAERKMIAERDYRSDGRGAA